MALSDDRRIQFEHNWANHDAKKHLSREHRDLWHTFKYGTRTHAYDGKRYVVWKLTEERCEVLEVLQLYGVGLSIEGGMWATLRTRSGLILQVTHEPSKLPSLDVFVWLPAFNEVRFTPRDWNDADAPRVLRVALNYKQMRSLEGGPEFETHYFNELRDFTRLNPNIAV